MADADGNRPPRLWASLVVALAAALMLLVTDRLLNRIAPPIVLREVEDGVRDFEKRDAQVLVLGSSHARTWVSLGDSLAARTGGTQQLVAVPLEYGKEGSYNWVFRHRLLPIIEERIGSASRGNLARFVLLTEWWDSCPFENNGPSFNLPARAWRWGDFLSDFVQHGLTDYNRNFLQQRWRRAWRWSALVWDRGQGRILPALKRVAVGEDSAASRANEEKLDRQWQHDIELGRHCMWSPGQVGELRAMLDTLKKMPIEVSLVIMPRKPATLTSLAVDSTLVPFADSLSALARSYGFTFVDIALGSPMANGDWLFDNDHMNANGNRKFAAWALDHNLRYLLEPPLATATRAGSGGAVP